MIDKVIIVDKKNIPNLTEDFVIINNMEIDNNGNLLIGISFNGGCKEHLFRLFGFFEDQKTLILILEHNSNGDDCKMIVSKDLLFDLSVVRNHYIEKYKENIQHNYITIKLQNIGLKYYIF
jgi:hypothetical protein